MKYKTGNVYCNGMPAGIIQYNNGSYVFIYDDHYLGNPDTPSISLSLSKSQKEYRSPVLFPFFFGLLAEGTDKALQCKTLKIDEQDHFARLLKTAGEETIGAVTVREVE